MENRICVQKERDIKNCIKIAEESDKCVECIEGTYLDPTGFICHENPDGIPNCEKYSDEKTCILCKPNNYLQENTCIEVEVLKRISGCLYYANEEQCSGCEEDKFLDGN